MGLVVVTVCGARIAAIQMLVTVLGLALVWCVSLEGESPASIRKVTNNKCDRQSQSQIGRALRAEPILGIVG